MPTSKRKHIINFMIIWTYLWTGLDGEFSCIGNFKFKIVLKYLKDTFWFKQELIQGHAMVFITQEVWQDDCNARPLDS